MSTHLAQTADLALGVIVRLASQAEILGTPMTAEDKAREAEAFAPLLREMAETLDHMLTGIVGDVDDHIGAMTDADRRLSRTLITDAVGDYVASVFEDYANGVWTGERPKRCPTSTNARLHRPREVEAA